MATYDPAAPLSAVEATIAGAASAAAPEQLFFFAAGRYLGTATSTPRVAISIECWSATSTRRRCASWSASRRST
jgi:hypothetical protein